MIGDNIMFKLFKKAITHLVATNRFNTSVSIFSTTNVPESFELKYEFK